MKLGYLRFLIEVLTWLLVCFLYGCNSKIQIAPKDTSDPLNPELIDGQTPSDFYSQFYYRIDGSCDAGVNSLSVSFMYLEAKLELPPERGSLKLLTASFKLFLFDNRTFEAEYRESESSGPKAPESYTRVANHSSTNLITKTESTPSRQFVIKGSWHLDHTDIALEQLGQGRGYVTEDRGVQKKMISLSTTGSAFERLPLSRVQNEVYLMLYNHSVGPREITAQDYCHKK